MPIPPLQADVYVAPQILAKPPKGKPYLWSPISCTLIRGREEAVLVDTPISTAQTNDLADWIDTLLPSKRLTYIYITHGHGDHFLGLSILQSRFPGARAVATAGTVAHMKQQLEPRAFDAMWGSLFAGQIPDAVVLADPLPASNEFHLEGQLLRAVEVGHSDTHDSTVLYVPSLKLAVCGDVVYGDVHQFLGEADTREKRDQWIRAIDQVEALGVETVVPGHKRPGGLDGIFNLHASRQYLVDFGEIIESGRVRNWKELSKEMLQRYPNRVNPNALFGGCMAAFAAKDKGKGKL